MSYRPPYYKMYPQDYLSSPTTRGMTLAEHGVYRKLLDYAWLEEPTATLPADLGILAKLTGIDRRILCKFTVKYRGLFRELAEDSQRIYNPRQMAEYQEFLQTCEKKRLAGIESGKARQAQRTSVQHPSNHTDTDTDKEVREEQHHSASPSPADMLDAETRTAAFDLFWEQWPRKQKKPAALRAWMKIPISEYPAITAGLGKWLKSEQWTRGVIPHPATWLNQKRWMDEDIPQGGSNGSTKPTVGDAMRTTLDAFRQLEAGKAN